MSTCRVHMFLTCSTILRRVSTVRILQAHTFLPGIRPASSYNPDEDEIFLEDQIESELGNPDVEIEDKQKRNLKKEHRIFVKNKIIQSKFKKMYRGPQMPNLLTWAARAQIQYLHEQDPIYWTPEMLADSFPTTPDVIRYIIKKKKLPNDEYDIYRHDRAVFRNWQKLKEAATVEGGPIDPAYRLLVEGEKLGLMVNAAGARSLPMPDMKLALQTKHDIAEQRKPKVPPIFSSLLESPKKTKGLGVRDANSNKNETGQENMKQFTFEDPKSLELLETLSEIYQQATGTNVQDTNSSPIRDKQPLIGTLKSMKGIHGANHSSDKVSFYDGDEVQPVSQFEFFDDEDLKSEEDKLYDAKTLSFDKSTLQKKDTSKKTSLRYSSYSHETSKMEKQNTLKSSRENKDDFDDRDELEGPPGGVNEVLQGSLEDIFLLDSAGSSRRARRLGRSGSGKNQASEEN
ncbi:uncharacterized protein LOC128226743 [Mya arenaria]|uniref:uncharacterized protein LOC128226743 n=1 Tax=Mya arenaria TaxID=6604 RepID=UPI0022E85C8C|nr:uncharacterized protein LOC128226743 [Mya arenaria]